MDINNHWSDIYASKAPDAVSWFQAKPKLSLELITRANADHHAHIVDAGSGASTLIDALLDAGYTNITAIDIAGQALGASQKRLGARAADVNWVVADLTQVQLPRQSVDVWHDRAVFHFLKRAADRWAYMQTVRDAVKPGGHVIIAAFALDGPTRCSNLDVVQYGPEQLQDELGDDFRLLETVGETHLTPWSSEQKFVYCLFQRSSKSR